MAGPHVVTALVRKRAEVAGEIEATRKRLDQFRADLVHLDAVLRLFDAAAEPAAIPAKRPWRRSGWFADGELPRRVLDTLRAATPEPLSTGEIATRIMAEKGLERGDARALELIRRGAWPRSPDPQGRAGAVRGAARRRAGRAVAARRAGGGRVNAISNSPLLLSGGKHTWSGAWARVAEARWGGEHGDHLLARGATRC